MFYGKNGSGKTNILDAVHYLAVGKSRFVPQDRMSIQYHQDFFRIESIFLDSQEKIKVILKYQSSQKNLEVNDLPVKRLAEHIGRIGIVLIAPDDLEVIDAGSALRRKYIDMTLSQVDRGYLQDLSQYKKLLDQRNAALKHSNYPDEVLFHVYAEKMDPLARNIYQKRKRFVAEIIPFFLKYYKQISGGKEKVGLKFESDLESASLLELFNESWTEDVRLKNTQKGCQRDDVQFLIGDHDVRYFGSQGQKKTFLLSLFLAQADYLSHSMKSTPLILLDDIFDKLDQERIKFLIQTLKDLHARQIIMTDTSKERLESIMHALQEPLSAYGVDQGKIY